MCRTTQFCLLGRLFRTVTALAAISLTTVTGSAIAADNPAAKNVVAETPGLGDPGQLQGLVLENGRIVDGRFELVGRDAPTSGRQASQSIRLAHRL